MISGADIATGIHDGSHDGVSDGVPADVVPAGRIARSEQPVLVLSNGMELRPWRADDADAAALMTAGQDPAIRRWNRFTVASPEQARRRIARMHERRRSETAAVWAIARPGGAALGLGAWGDIDLADGSAEIVYWVLPEARGAGIVAEATRALTRWALDDLGLHRLRLCHSVANPASCRVAEKTGYTLEGTRRSALLHADGWHDQHLHARVAGDA
ncbi:GNAT family N-acetyltransferase [Streptomyces sp. NPDC048297]|uniref:GNAT family N-acetyltransferase n=1 Tax=Streptomyces sp. NPDC048297 TaxID=3365531 RepID=UPI003711F1CD